MSAAARKRLETSRSNRTFMELKLGLDAAISAVDKGSNRTFMELKLVLFPFRWQLL